MSTLEDAELDRYARHIVLREVGGAGQLKLKAASVAVVGAGGIGSPAIQYLAAAGVGRLVLIDDDHVDLSNLQRQTLFGDADVGTAKVAAARAAAERITPHVVIEPLQQHLDPTNAATLLAGVDVVLDGTDSFATRLAVADAAHALRIPLVSSAVGQFEGQLGVFRGWEPDKPCYRCFVGNSVDTAGDSLRRAGRDRRDDRGDGEPRRARGDAQHRRFRRGQRGQAAAGRRARLPFPHDQIAERPRMPGLRLARP